jgi:glucokinase
MHYYLGLDIGGTKIAAGIVNDLGEVLVSKTCPTPIKEGGPKILENAIALAAQLINDCGKKVEGIGIGAGGQIDTVNGLVYSATDLLPGWRGLRIAEAVSNKLHLKVAVENDVNVLALAEVRFGAAASIYKSTVLFLALGTGVGGAFISNGSLHHGANWSGCEFGHILLTMDPKARKDGGGAVGTLEAYCSGGGLVETWRELTGCDGETITGEDIVAEAQGNPGGPAAAAITKTGEYLGYGLVSLTNAFDPHLIIVGGGLATIGNALLDPARKILNKMALPGPAVCRVVPAHLGTAAPVIGAASLVMPQRREELTP